MKKIYSTIILIIVISHSCLCSNNSTDSIEFKFGKLIIVLPAAPKVSNERNIESFALETKKTKFLGYKSDLTLKKDFKIPTKKDSIIAFYKTDIAEASKLFQGTPTDIKFFKLGKYNGAFYKIKLLGRKPEFDNTIYSVLIIIDNYYYNFTYMYMGNGKDIKYSEDAFINLFKINKNKKGD